MPLEELICTGNDIFYATKNSPKAKTGAELKELIEDIIVNNRYTDTITENMVKEFVEAYFHTPEQSLWPQFHYILILSQQEKRLYARRIFD